MSVTDVIGLLAVFVVIVGGIVHLHVRLEAVRADVKWIKRALVHADLMPGEQD